MLTDCPKCWDTPCICGYEYWFMPLDKLIEVAAAARKALGDRRGNRRPPGAVQDELARRQRNAEAIKRMTSEEWHRSIEIPAKQLLAGGFLRTTTPADLDAAFAARALLEAGFKKAD